MVLRYTLDLMGKPQPIFLRRVVISCLWSCLHGRHIASLPEGAGARLVFLPLNVNAWIYWCESEVITRICMNVSLDFSGVIDELETENCPLVDSLNDGWNQAKD